MIHRTMSGRSTTVKVYNKNIIKSSISTKCLEWQISSIGIHLEKFIHFFLVYIYIYIYFFFFFFFFFFLILFFFTILNEKRKKKEKEEEEKYFVHWLLAKTLQRVYDDLGYAIQKTCLKRRHINTKALFTI